MSGSCPVSARVCRETARERDELRAEVEAQIARAEKAEACHAALRGAVVTEPSILYLAASDIERQGTGFGGLPRSLPRTLRGLADAIARDDAADPDQVIIKALDAVADKRGAKALAYLRDNGFDVVRKEKR